VFFIVQQILIQRLAIKFTAGMWDLCGLPFIGVILFYIWMAFGGLRVADALLVDPYFSNFSE
jgi:hypothetical protein